MPKLRTQIPSVIAIEVMFLHDRTCCICQEKDKRVQIHHIDENPSNHDVQNLAVLCLECHDKTQIRGGFARHLQAGEVKRFRDDWIKRIQHRRQHADKHAALEMSQHFPGNRPSIRVRSSDTGLQIVDSFLVSSFTDNGIGDFSVNFATSLDPERLVVRVDGDRTLHYEMTPSSDSARIRFTDPDRRSGEDPKIFLATFDDGTR